ncbi:hypothetical protein M2G59_02330 [Vibrio vulnificus]|uniref:hypothetical protein n=1 Tax=Vibrio TaxID=662 RepID=UPI000A170F9A|nr:hypothetical protein [Vibrio harveyi]EHH1049902.1 hypothetical protein [Vibrio parahaemolyticus]MCU8278813.1 hypothetical protein [Vibrio vulnificus]EJG0967679.1 hypothetical protein [Vibrio parahaemolyticus]MDF4308269.1 hypothetical protein [Vibrio parahaemolyticus]MDF5070999.1 hypothetical protein [Vibrio parahaemolyticus]
MLKVKLYQVGTPASKGLIYDNFNNHLYSDETGFGFELVDDSEDNLILQFVERVISKIEIESVDGEVSEIETVSYIKVKFGIRFNTKYGLYVINPPRSMKYPFEMIRMLFGSDSGLKPVELNLKKLLNVFASKYDYVVKSMSLSNIQCDPNTVAKTKIASSKDLNQFYLENYSETPAVIDTIHMLVNGIDMELSRTGRFRIHETNLQTLMLMLDHSFQ